LCLRPCLRPDRERDGIRGASWRLPAASPLDARLVHGLAAMTPAARLQAAIELLDRIVAAAQDDGAAADTLIARYFAERRYAGSKDRRAVRELVYRAVRA